MRRMNGDKGRKGSRKILTWSLLIGLAGALLVTSWQNTVLGREKEEIQKRLDREIQEGIAGEIFRLHVIANSDSEEDQELKMEVKKTVVAYLKENLGEEAGLEETRSWVLENLSEIEEAAEKTVEDRGETYPVSASVENTYFPDKTYGDCTFPAGEYEALNVRIGRGEGKNWWCVLYPSLCFIDDTWGIVTEEKKEELKEVLTEEEFQKILGDPEEKKKIRIGFKWF